MQRFSEELDEIDFLVDPVATRDKIGGGGMIDGVFAEVTNAHGHLDVGVASNDIVERVDEGVGADIVA